MMEIGLAGDRIDLVVNRRPYVTAVHEQAMPVAVMVARSEQLLAVSVRRLPAQVDQRPWWVLVGFLLRTGSQAQHPEPVVVIQPEHFRADLRLGKLAVPKPCVRPRTGGSRLRLRRCACRLPDRNAAVGMDRREARA